MTWLLEVDSVAIQIRWSPRFGFELANEAVQEIPIQSAEHLPGDDENLTAFCQATVAIVKAVWREQNWSGVRPRCSLNDVFAYGIATSRTVVDAPGMVSRSLARRLPPPVRHNAICQGLS